MDNYDKDTGEVLTPGMPAAIAAAIVAVKKQIRQLGDDTKNVHGGYAYVSVDKFYERIGKLMADAGLALLIDETATDVRLSDKSQNPWLFAQYTLSFMHESGAMSGGLRRSIALPISGPQAYGSAQSYIEKQFLRQIFKVPTGDRDADETAPDTGVPNRTEAVTRAPPQRQKAAEPPSANRADAQKRYNEMKNEIDASPTIADLDTIDGCLPWQAMEKAVAAAEPPERATELLAGLRFRIAKRRERLMTGETYE